MMTRQDPTTVQANSNSGESNAGSRARLLAGSLLAYAFNAFVSALPIHAFRHFYLRRWLGGIGAGTTFQMGCRFLNGRKVHFGERNVINADCFFDGRCYEIRTGNDVSIGPEASILTLGHDPRSPDFADRGGPVTIGDRAWICYRAIILPGIIIGEGAVVAAGAVVTKDVPPFTIVAGNPAMKIGCRPSDLRYHLHNVPFLR